MIKAVSSLRFYALFACPLLLLGCSKAPDTIEEAVKYDSNYEEVSCDDLDNRGFLGPNITYKEYAFYEYENDFRFKQCRPELDSLYEEDCDRLIQMVRSIPFSTLGDDLKFTAFICGGGAVFAKKVLATSPTVMVDTENSVVIIEKDRATLFKIGPATYIQYKDIDGGLIAIKLILPDGNKIEWAALSSEAKEFIDNFEFELKRVERDR